MGCTASPAFSKVPDARRQGVTTEAYQPYASGRNDRRQRSRRDCMVDQGYPVISPLPDQHNPDIHDIGVGGPGFNQIVQSVKKRICVILL